MCNLKMITNRKVYIVLEFERNMNQPTYRSLANEYMQEARLYIEMSNKDTPIPSVRESIDMLPTIDMNAIREDALADYHGPLTKDITGRAMINSHLIELSAEVLYTEILPDLRKQIERKAILIGLVDRKVLGIGESNELN